MNHDWGGAACDAKMEGFRKRSRAQRGDGEREADISSLSRKKNF